MAKQKTELAFTLTDGVSAGLAKISKGVADIDKSLTKVAVTATAAGAALAIAGAAAGIGAGIVAAADLESAVARAGQAVGATSEQLATLADTAQAAGIATGFSAVEAAGGLEALGRAGLSATDAITALEPVLAVAKTSNIALQDAAGRVADTLDQFGLAGDRAAEVANTLAAAAAGSGTSFAQLSDGLTQAGPAARTAGVSFATTAAALGLLAKNGLEGGKAGGALRGILEALEDPTSKFSKALTEAGIKSRDFSTVIAELGTKGAAGEAAIQSLGARGTAALQALLREGGGALQQFTTDIKNSEDAALRAARLINDTLGGAFTELKNTVINAGADFFTPVLGPLQQGLADASAAIAEFAQSPEFAALRESFRAAFEDGLTFVRNFIAEFDFAEALASVQQFVDDAGAKLQGFAQTADEVASIIRGAVAIISGLFNALQTGVAVAVASASKSMSLFLIPLAAISETAADAKFELDELAKKAMLEAATQAQQLRGNFSGLTGEIESFGTSVDKTEGIVSRTARSHKNLTAETLAASRAASESKFAFEDAGNAVGDTGKKAFEAAPGFSSLGQELIAVEGAIATALANGASRDAVEGMVQRAKDLKKAIDEAAAAAEKGKSKLKDMGDSGAKAFSGAAEAAIETAEAVEGATESTSRAANAAEAGAASIATVVAGLYSAFGETSRGAAELFAELQKAANFGSIGLDSYGKSIEAADQGTQRAIASAKAFGENSVAAFNDFAESGTLAGNEAAGAFFRTSGALDAVELSIKNGVGAFGLMDSQTLSNVQAALDKARAKVQALEADARAATESLASIGDQLEEQALRDSGNEEEIARRAYERKVQEIQALAETAGAAGQAAAARAESLARDELNRALKRIAERKAAEIAAANETADARIQANERVDRAAAEPAGVAGTGLAPQLNQGQGPGPTTVRESTTISPTFNISGDFTSVAARENIARLILRDIERLQARRR